jgi:hypothetical protein
MPKLQSNRLELANDWLVYPGDYVRQSNRRVLLRAANRTRSVPAIFFPKTHLMHKNALSVSGLVLLVRSLTAWKIAYGKNIENRFVDYSLVEGSDGVCMYLYIVQNVCSSYSRCYDF